MIALPLSEMPEICPDSACPHRVDSHVHFPYTKSRTPAKRNAKLQQATSPPHARLQFANVRRERQNEMIDSKSVFDANTFHTNSADENSGRL
jgi:hypothetical protein